MNKTTLLKWRTISDNPLNKKVREALRSKILDARLQYTDLDLNDYMLLSVKGKKVLDIGLCEHDLTHIDSLNWKHKKISTASKYCLGIDIIPELIDLLKSRGFNVRLFDATSSEFLGEKFDVVFIGDVIEHVNDAIKLLQFAGRHLNPQGKIIVTTPNPFYLGYLYGIIKNKTYIANADHISWITPTNALEIGARANINLSNIVFTLKNPLKAFLAKILPLEIIQSYYIYEFSLEE